MNIMVIYSLIVSAFCLLSLKYFPVPWIWIFSSAIILLLALAFKAKNQLSKIVLLNVMALPVALLLAESYFYFDPLNESIIRTGTYTTDGYITSNELLGYAPIPGIQRTLKLMQDDEVVYDVTYTINDNGLRNTPSSNSSSEKCVLFFGGSFTFGEGLNDNETLPYFVGKELNENFRIFNFGFHGYGPHQMLSAIENGVVDNITKECRQSDVVYSSIPGHIARVAGYSPWDTYGPEYVLDNETLLYKGHFSEAPHFISKVKFQLRKSLLYTNIFDKQKYITNEDQKNTFIAVIERSQNILQKTKNVSRFIIIFWEKNNLSTDVDTNNSDSIITELSKRNFEYYLAGEILDRYNKERQLYSISPHDAHPNSDANRLIAKHLVKKLESKH